MFYVLTTAFQLYGDEAYKIVEGTFTSISLLPDCNHALSTGTCLFVANSSGK